MTKTYDYDSKGDQRISIQYTKLFSPIKVFVDGEEVHRFPNKKEVSFGDSIEVGNDKLFIRYVRSEDNFEVKVNGEHNRKSANHPARFLKKLAVGPFVYGGIGLLILIILLSFYAAGSIANFDPLSLLFFASVTVVRVGIGVGLIRKIPVFYVLGFIWITLECVISFLYFALSLDSGIYLAVVSVFFKCIVFVHFLRKQKKYQELRTIIKSKKRNTHNILDQ